MLVFGHAGLGLFFVRKWIQTFPLAWFFLGTLLPDLIDKPLYYFQSWMFDLRGAELGLISGTRTLGHTLMLTLIFFGVGKFKRSLVFWALAWGSLTHLFLDHVGDLIYSLFFQTGGEVHFSWNSPEVVGFFWPFLGNEFPDFPWTNDLEHLKFFKRPHLLVGEVLGILVLWRFFKKVRSKNERTPLSE